MANAAAPQIHFFFIALSPSGFFIQSCSPPLRRGDVGRRMTTAKGSRYGKTRRYESAPGVQEAKRGGRVAANAGLFRCRARLVGGQANRTAWANVRWAGLVAPTRGVATGLPALKQPVKASPFILSPSLVFGVETVSPGKQF